MSVQQIVRVYEIRHITNYNKLTPWSRVLLEKLIVTQLVKRFLTFYGTQRFITVFTRVYHHCTLS